MGHRFIYLVRHAQYIQNGQEDGGLTETGILQARLTAEVLGMLDFNTIHCSTMLRTVETARIIMGEFPDKQAQPSDLLRECIPSIPPRLSAFYASSTIRTQPSDEETGQCAERLEHAFRHYVTCAGDEDEYDLLVTHGNLIRYFVARALDADPDIWVKMIMYNCGMSLIVVDPQGSTSLISHNEAGHLPLELRTHT